MQITIDGRTFRVDATGCYDELIDAPLAQLEMGEDYQNTPRVAKYAKMYEDGSPFPPIALIGLTSTARKYRICNGHHRYLAAKQLRLKTIPAWTCFYAEYHRDYAGALFPTLARVSETPIGRRIARALGITWCSHCGSSLNMTPDNPLCASCQLTVKAGIPLQDIAFETLDAGLGYAT